MLYLGIDQHRKQLTVNLRNEEGEVVLKRQVSTQWDRVRKFFEELEQQAEAEGGFMAIVELCGFNDWLLQTHEEQENRQLTALRKRTVALRTQTINKVQHILLKHNMQQECPTKGIKTKKARKWLVELPLGEIDRLEMNQLLARWELWDSQIADIGKRSQAGELLQ